MPVTLRRIAAKTALATVLSIAASLALALTVVPALGGVVDGNAWLMCVLCPLAIAAPASAFQFYQNERLRAAHDQIATLHARLHQAHERLAERARRDGMTGVLNRESFFAEVDARLSAGERGALLLIDADHFKAINDRHGHPVGDAALLALTDAIRSVIRIGDDLAGRVGGEEFALYMPGMATGDAVALAQRIREAVAAIDFRSAQGASVALTVSIGGVVSRPETTLPELVAAADRELYAAKGAGRDTVRFASLEPKAESASR